MDGKTFWTENDIAMVWNRFEQVRTKILTFKFELKSHFIIIQNLKMLKYLQLRRLEFARSGSLFFKITKFIKIQISKIDLRNSAKFQSAKFQKLQSSILIRQQIRSNTALLAEITFDNCVGSKLGWEMIQTVCLPASIVVSRGCVRLNIWSAWSALNESWFVWNSSRIGLIKSFF